MGFRRLLAAITFLLLFTATAVLAQSDGARLTGRVTDASGAALPGVAVTIASPRLSAPVVVVTDSVGRYNAPPLPPGTYAVTFELAGFEAGTREGLELQAGQVFVLDRHLTLAQVTETVEVVASAPPPPGPAPRFEAPRPPQTQPVPPEVLASVCGPGQPELYTLTLGRIVGHRDEKNRTLFGAGDILVLDAGQAVGAAPGQNYVVRRRFRVGDKSLPMNGASFGEHTAGLVQVVHATTDHSIAVVVYACGELVAGDSIEPFDPLPMLRALAAGTPQFDEPAQIVFGEDGHDMGAPRQLMVIDRGRAHGAERGQRVTIFRRPQGTRGPVSAIADAIVIAVRADSATIRIERASDAVVVGDMVAFHR
jgi:hypothetical protein